jgi:hypothetical protein
MNEDEGPIVPDNVCDSKWQRTPARPEQREMSSKHYTRIVHKGDYVAQVDVELVYADEGWFPCLSLEDAYRLDDVRAPLKQGALKGASRLGTGLQADSCGRVGMRSCDHGMPTTTLLGERTFLRNTP